MAVGLFFEVLGHYLRRCALGVQARTWDFGYLVILGNLEAAGVGICRIWELESLCPVSEARACESWAVFTFGHSHGARHSKVRSR